MFQNFLNLCNHEADYGLTAEWHFFTTSHGKGAGDGLAGSAKALARRASLQRPYDNQILTPKAFFDFVVEKIPKITFSFTTNSEYKEECELLKERLLLAKTIKGTQKNYCFIPNSMDTLLMKLYSTSENTSHKKVC